MPQYKVGDFVRVLPGYDTWSGRRIMIDESLSGKRLNKYTVSAVNTDHHVMLDEPTWNVLTKFVVPFKKIIVYYGS